MTKGGFVIGHSVIRHSGNGPLDWPAFEFDGDNLEEPPAAEAVPRLPHLFGGERVLVRVPPLGAVLLRQP